MMKCLLAAVISIVSFVSFFPLCKYRRSFSHKEFYIRIGQTTEPKLNQTTLLIRIHAVLLLSVSSPRECESNAIVVRNEVLLCSVIDHMTLTFDL